MNEIVETIHDKQNSPIQLQDLLKNVKESLDFSIGHDSLSLLFENAGFIEHCNQLVKNGVRISNCGKKYTRKKL